MMSDPALPWEYRYERKFAVEHGFRWHAEHALLLNRAHFSPIHAPRWVNNIYLDTPEWTSFQENRDGDADERAKVRIRWYGDYTGPVERPVLEMKIRNGYVNRKRSFPLSPLVIGEGLSWSHLLATFEKSALPESLRSELTRLQPALANRYRRSYFLSGSRHVRATVDSELSFAPLLRGDNHLLAWSRSGDPLIVELKYAVDFDAEAREIACQLPYRLTRSSKYVTGVLQVAG